MVLLGCVYLLNHPEQEPRALLEPTGAGHGTACMIFNLPDYRVASTVVLLDGIRHTITEFTLPPGCPRHGVTASGCKERPLPETA